MPHQVQFDTVRLQLDNFLAPIDSTRWSFVRAARMLGKASYYSPDIQAANAAVVEWSNHQQMPATVHAALDSSGHNAHGDLVAVAGSAATSVALSAGFVRAAAALRTPATIKGLASQLQQGAQARTKIEHALGGIPSGFVGQLVQAAEARAKSDPVFATSLHQAGSTLVSVKRGLPAYGTVPDTLATPAVEPMAPHDNPDDPPTGDESGMYTGEVDFSCEITGHDPASDWLCVGTVVIIIVIILCTKP